MSLIPYASEREVVLRQGQQVVVWDAHLRQLQVADESQCPYCRRPWRQDNVRDADERPQPYVDPEYFGMLAHSQRPTPRNSRASTPIRSLSPATLRAPAISVDPPTGASFVGSSPAPTEGISSSAFSPGFFKQFFLEKGVLGRGGNGVVLLVEHVMDRVSLGQFACKRVPVGNNHTWLEKVLTEVKLLQKIPHRNLVQYHWVWLEDHQPNRFGPSIPCLFILQQYCNGGDLHQYVLGKPDGQNTAESLKQKLRRKSRGEDDGDPPDKNQLSFETIFSFFRDITCGLHHLHSKGYIHRDLKPSNCLLQHDGGRTRVLISDFGEVQAAGTRRGSTGATGTILYCAPEVLREVSDGRLGNFSTKSDIFSLGMIVYFMCFGKLPYRLADGTVEATEDADGLRAEIMSWAGFDDAARARPDLPDKLYRFLRRLLSRDIIARPSTEELLESIRSGGNLSESPLPKSPPNELVPLRPRSFNEESETEKARLMLPPPPPPPPPLSSRPARLDMEFFRVTMLVLKTVSLSQTCSPYAVRSWVWLPLFTLAVVDMILHADAKRSMIMLGIHVAVMAYAALYSNLCERLYDGSLN
ncbi:kinase-like protein [Piedraia hortae CBS 480.64]|uniref:non-specific serine/threonine protein kinase n=1 Tax=Piedraia hortae CBS 480.64 TaxID=1314780 RepID=A0A6A7BY99_9PEZI|nr:kinase-like protein [Piedraia hortae CBS 480.64]